MVVEDQGVSREREPLRLLIKVQVLMMMKKKKIK
jgi:hypothetical protein